MVELDDKGTRRTIDYIIIAVAVGFVLLFVGMTIYSHSKLGDETGSGGMFEVATLIVVVFATVTIITAGGDLLSQSDLLKQKQFKQK